MLPIVPFETHAAAKALTAVGAGEKIAVAVVEVAQEAAAEHGRELATRADVAGLSVELAATRTEIETAREATRADIAELRAEQARMETRLVKIGGRDRAGHRGAGRRGPAVAVMTMRLRRTGCAQDRQPV